LVSFYPLSSVLSIILHKSSVISPFSTMLTSYMIGAVEPAEFAARV
jgi:hypothetical protein